MNNEQLIHLLISMLGSGAGGMASPETFIPIFIAGYHVKTSGQAFLYAIPCSLIPMMISAYIASTWSMAGWTFLSIYIASSIAILTIYLTKSLFLKGVEINNKGQERKPTAKKPMRLVALLSKKPGWLHHEGAWRVLQVLRIGIPSVAVALMLIEFLIEGSKDELGVFLIAITVIAIGSFSITHFSFRLTTWVLKGFSNKNDKKQINQSL